MQKAKVIPLPGAKTPVQHMLAPRQDDALDMPFDEVIRLTGDSAANGDKRDAIVLQGRALECAQGWLSRYGFERLPATYGELMAMYDYCMELEVLSGFDSVASDLLAEWQQSSLRVQAKYDPAKLQPLKLFIEQNIQGLLAYHATNDTLTKLGLGYNEFDHEFETASDSATTS